MKTQKKYFSLFFGLLIVWLLIQLPLYGQKTDIQLTFEKKYNIEKTLSNGHIIFDTRQDKGLADSKFNIVLEPIYIHILSNPDGTQLTLFENIVGTGYNDGGGFLTTSYAGIFSYDLLSKEKGKLIQIISLFMELVIHWAKHSKIEANSILNL
ncbi:MAG: hypothetical protein IPL23_25475 [Saprospiraceae bacterium]|nr:hypothetical protein [Saprospiraceae bacterium]